MSKIFTRILVPIDFSAHSTKALHLAANLAECFSASLSVLHVISKEVEWRTTHRQLEAHDIALLTPFSESLDVPTSVTEKVAIDLHERAQVELREFLPPELASLSPELLVRVGHPFEQILETAADEHIDLIVMGTHGRSGLAHTLLGSVAERVVRMAPCPVLTVKTPEEPAS